MEKQGGILSLPPAAVTPKSLLVDGAVEGGGKSLRDVVWWWDVGDQPDGRSR